MDLFEIDSINFNNNDITFNKNISNINDELYDKTDEIVDASLIRKIIINNEIICENYNMSMEIDDRLIPEFSTCTNKFLIYNNKNISYTIYNEIQSIYNLGIKNHNFLQVNKNNRYE